MSGYENKRIPGGGEHADSWVHSRILNTFRPLDPANAFTQADAYWKARNEWEDGVNTFARSIQASIAQAWSGPAAEQSKNAIAKYTNDALNLTNSLEELFCRVRDAATAISNTKKAIPDTVDFSWDERVFHWTRWILSDDRSRAEQTAREAMTQHYVQPFSEMDGKIPVLPTPVGPTASVDIPAPPPGGYHSGETGGPNPNDPGQRPGSTYSGVPGDKDGDGKPDEQQPTTDESKQDQQSSDTTPSNTSTAPAGVDPTSTAPTTTDPTKTDPTKTVPTSTGTPHSPGTPGTPGIPGTPSLPQPGRSVLGAPGTPGTTANPAAAAATAASTRGMAGAPGMMSPGARGGAKDEESSHKIPDYLITQENTEELLGELPRTLPGGVIGGDIQS
ncbi:WXG100 family type VII secretion target [Nocardia sp. R7R-8]|uniref:WXG100 family type VII secretion target n=1 Tax=Nocardia sp. R7R-8 TaxID=3459304 RepID=UPI00403E346B